MSCLGGPGRTLGHQPLGICAFLHAWAGLPKLRNFSASPPMSTACPPHVHQCPPHVHPMSTNDRRMSTQAVGINASRPLSISASRRLSWPLVFSAARHFCFSAYRRRCPLGLDRDRRRKRWGNPTPWAKCAHPRFFFVGEDKQGPPLYSGEPSCLHII